MMLDEMIDAAASWTTAKTGSQLCEVGFISGGHNFDLAIFSVAHPAAEVELAGLAVHEPAKAYALYTTLNQEMKNHCF